MIYKKIITLSLIFILISAILSGCANGSSNGNSVKSPGNLAYLTDNQLTINDINVGKDGEPIEERSPSTYDLSQMSQEDKDAAIAKSGDNLFFFGTLIQIDGLSDAELQSTINEQLKTLFVSCVDKIPPYRGIIPTLGTSPEKPADIEDQYVGMSVSANFNNILSVSVSTSNWFKNALKPEDSVVISSLDTLNIDLNTGNEIKLTDLFCDDVDAIELSNNFISEQLSKSGAEDDEIYSMDTPVKLASPFKGIKEDQKFFIYNGGISFVFDYETPEFNTDFSPGTMQMPFDENMAITKRYFKENENIYTAQEPWNKTLLYQQNIRDRQYSDYENGDISFSVTGRWSSKLPEEIQKSLEDYCNIDKSAIKEHMQPALDKAYADYPKSEVWAYYYKDTFADEIGNYISVFGTESSTVYQYNWETSEDTVYYMEETSTDYKLYKSGGKEALTLDQLFKPDVDYKELLKQAITKTINQSFVDRQTWEPESTFYDFGNGATKVQDLEYVSKLVDAINGFYITSDSIAFSFNNQDEIFQDVYGESPADYPDGNIYASVGYILFKNIGCDNLTLFD